MITWEIYRPMLLPEKNDLPRTKIRAGTEPRMRAGTETGPYCLNGEMERYAITRGNTPPSLPLTSPAACAILFLY